MADETLTGGANFTEVIEVKFNDASFTSGLNAMMTKYRAFLKQINAEAQQSGIDANKALGGAQLQGIDVALQEFTKNVRVLRKELMDIFSPLSNDELEKQMSANDDTVKEAVAKSLDEAKSAAEKKETLETQSEQRITAAQRTEFEKREILKAKAYDAESARVAKGLEQAQAFATSLTDTMTTAANKQLAANKKRPVSSPMDDELKRSQIQQQVSNSIAASLEKEGAARERLAARAAAADDKLRQKQEAALNKQSEQQFLQGRSTLTKFGDAFTPEGGWASAIGNVARFLVLWKSVQLVFDAVLKGIQLIKGEFTNGWNELVQDEQRAADYKATLLQTVQYSKDLGENYQKAGEAADYLVGKIDKLASLSGLDVKTLQGGFQAFMHAGGAQLTGGDVDQAAEMTTLLALAVKMNNGLVNSRTLANEIQNFVSGNVEKSKRLLDVLGLTVAQAKQIVEHARTQGDLYDAMRPKLDALIERMKDQEGTLTGVEAAFGLVRKAIDEAFAKPLFDWFKGVLADITVYLNDHHAQFVAIAGAIGQMIPELLSAIGAILRWSTGIGSIITLLGGGNANGVLGLLTLIVETINTILAGFTAGVRIVGAFTSVLSGVFRGEFKDSAEAAKAFFATVTKENDEFHKKVEASGHRVRVAFGEESDTPKKPGKGKPLPNSDVLDKKTGDKELGVLRSQFSDAMAEIKNQYAQAENAIQEAVSAKQMSVEEGTTKTLALTTKERGAVLGLVDVYMREALATKASVEGKQKFLDMLDKEYQAVDKTANATDKRSKIEAAADERQQHLNDLTAKQNSEKLATQAQLADVQDKYNKGLVSATALAQAKAGAANQELQQQLATLLVQRSLVGEGTTEYKNYQNQINLLLQKLQIQQQVDQRNHTAAGIQDQLNKAAGESIDASNKEADAQFALNRATELGFANAKEEISTRKEAADAHLKAAAAALAEAKAKEALALADQKANPQKYYQAQANTSAAQRTFDQAQFDQKNLSNGIDTEGLKKLLGFGDLKVAFQDFSHTIQTVNTLMQSFGSGLGNIIRGFQQGGVGGGLSALGGAATDLSKSTGFASILGKLGNFGKEVGSLLGPVGAALSIGGSIISGITSLFTSGAKKIGETIAKEINGVMEKYANKQLTLGETITELQQERQNAINQLSGKKGGQDELNKILPDLDKQIQQLQQQQAQVKQTFEQNLIVISQQGDEAQKWVQSWIQINQQVKDYLDAVGRTPQALQYATQFLNANLAQQRTQLQDSLRDDERSAIQDAINLNDILKQRNDLETQRSQIISDYKKTEFDILSADSLERREAAAVVQGKQLVAARKDRDDKLAALQDQEDALDAQIKQETAKVDLERQVFNIAKDTATLRNQDYVLALQQLDEMKEKWWSIQNILAQTNGLVSSDGGFYGNQLIAGLTAIPGFGATNAPPPQPVNVNIYNPVLPGNPGQYANELKNVLNRGGRVYGRFLN